MIKSLPLHTKIHKDHWCNDPKGRSLGDGGQNTWPVTVTRTREVTGSYGRSKRGSGWVQECWNMVSKGDRWGYLGNETPPHESYSCLSISVSIRSTCLVHSQGQTNCDPPLNPINNRLFQPLMDTFQDLQSDFYLTYIKYLHLGTTNPPTYSSTPLISTWNPSTRFFVLPL